MLDAAAGRITAEAAATEVQRHWLAQREADDGCATAAQSLLAGGAMGPWVTGVLYDIEGAYTAAFAVALGFSVLGAASIWFAAPGKVRMVAGRVPKS